MSDQIELFRNSNLAFMQYFHAPHMEEGDTIPDFHVVIADRMLTSELPQFACAVPREHAKTTIAKLMVVKALMFHDYTFPLYVSDTHGVASAACKDIYHYFTSDEYVKLTGEQVQKLSIQLSMGVYQFRIRWFPPGYPTDQRYYKIVNLLARGSGQQIRGTNKDHMRPDFLVLDDVETEENTGSKEQFDKYKKWLYGPVFKAMRRRKHRKIQIGNLISAQSVLLKNLTSEYWTSMRYGAIKPDKTPLWPELWSREDLAKDYKEYADIGLLGTWYAEMMNLPYDPDASLVDIGKVKFMSVPEPADPIISAAWINIDPAISKKSTADRCAIVATIMYDTGVIQHVEVYARQGMDFHTIYEVATAMAQRWFTKAIFIENEAFQAVLLPVFDMLAGMEGEDYTFTGVPTAGVAKLARLRAWAGFLHRHEVALSFGDSEITGELSNFDRTKKENRDDVIDACAQLPTVLNSFFHIVLDSRVVSSVNTGYPGQIVEGTLI